MDPSSKRKWPIPEAYHYDAWIAERTNALLDQYKEQDENFFLWASFFDPHPDYFAPEPWDTLYDPDTLSIPHGIVDEHEKNPPHFQLTQQKKPDYSAYQETGFSLHGCHSHLYDKTELKKDIAVYYGMVSLMDKYIGKILDKLEELGLAENTVVVFTSDHGHFYGHHDLIAKGPFHYEDMIRVPFIVSYPGKVPEGMVSDELQSLVDLAPTFLSLCDLPIPAGMTGFDQKPIWFGENIKGRDHILCENRHEPTTLHLKTYVDSRYKMTVYYNKSYGELLDLENDPQETNNLWDDPNAQDLKRDLLLRFLWAELGKEPLPMPRIW